MLFVSLPAGRRLRRGLRLRLTRGAAFDVRGTLPDGERRRVVGEGVAEERVKLAHRPHPLFDESVNPRRGRDVRALALSLPVDRFGEGVGLFVQILDEGRGHPAAYELVFEGQGVRGERARELQERRVVEAAREAKLVFESGRGVGDDARRAAEGFDKAREFVANGGLARRALADGTLAR